MSQSHAINRDLSNDINENRVTVFLARKDTFSVEVKKNLTMKLLAAIVSTVFSQACGPTADLGGAFWPGQSPEG